MVTFICAVVQEPNDCEFMLQLYQDYGRLMFATARKYMADSTDCEDIVQDGLLKLMQKVDTLRPMEPHILAGYIVATIRNTAISWLRNQQRMREHQCSLYEESAECADGDNLSPEELMLLAERKRALTEIWELLTLEEQMLLEGKYVLRYADRELAQLLRCKPGSIRMKLTRVRRRVLQLLIKWEGGRSDKA